MGINVDCPKTQGGFVHVSLGVQPCCKCRASQGSGGAAVGILCQQDPGRCRDEVLASGEVGVGTSACHKEAVSLFSSSHLLCTNRIPLVVVVEEIRLYRQNS